MVLFKSLHTIYFNTICMQNLSDIYPGPIVLRIRGLHSLGRQRYTVIGNPIINLIRASLWCKMGFFCLSLLPCYALIKHQKFHRSGYVLLRTLCPCSNQLFTYYPTVPHKWTWRCWDSSVICSSHWYHMQYVWSSNYHCDLSFLGPFTNVE